MRIISGSSRGTKLYTLEGENTRPTLDRIKESLFNIINNNILDSKVLDLFAGSGALGLECASRGAKEVYLCDISKQAVEIINKNVEKTRLNEKVKVVKQDSINLLDKSEDTFDIIFIDPPYNSRVSITSCD